MEALQIQQVVNEHGAALADSKQVGRKHRKQQEQTEYQHAVANPPFQA